MYDIKLGDCLEIMKNIPLNSVDMILTDLPYGLSKNPKDIKINLELLWKQYERIIKDNGVIALFAQGIFYVDLVNSNRKLFRYDIIWDKELATGFLNANRAPLRAHEQGTGPQSSQATMVAPGYVPLLLRYCHPLG